MKSLRADLLESCPSDHLGPVIAVKLHSWQLLAEAWHRLSGTCVQTFKHSWLVPVQMQALPALNSHHGCGRICGDDSSQALPDAAGYIRIAPTLTKTASRDLEPAMQATLTSVGFVPIEDWADIGRYPKQA